MQSKVGEFCPQMDIQSYDKDCVLEKGNALAPGHAGIVGIMYYLRILSAAFLPLPHADIEATLTANPNSKQFLRQHIFLLVIS